MLIGVVSAFAEDMQKTIDIIYRSIKIYVDGAEYVTKDTNGEIVEPFIYNGTTYLPVRGVANAFGKGVIWDGATASIFLGKTDQNQPDNWLDKIQYSYVGKGHANNNLWKINGTISDYLKNDYNSGMLFYIYEGHGDYYIVKDDPDGAGMMIDYPLNSTYRNLAGKIVFPQSIAIAGTRKEDNLNQNKTVDVLFFADGKKIHTANSVTNTMPFNFDLDVSGVNKLTIKIKSEGSYTYLALTDLALYK